MADKKHGAGMPPRPAQAVWRQSPRRATVKLLGWSLALLSAALVVPDEAFSADCDYARQLYRKAVRECAEGKVYEGVKYQPCEMKELLERSYRTCRARMLNEPRPGVGVAVVLRLSAGSSGKLILASEPAGYEAAIASARSECPGWADTCEEIAKFGDTCVAFVRELGGSRSHKFHIAKGDRLEDVEKSAYTTCVGRNRCADDPDPNGPCGNYFDRCSLVASGCSAKEVVNSLNLSSLLYRKKTHKLYMELKPNAQLRNFTKVAAEFHAK